VYVEQTNGKSLILDSGTGIAQLGEKLIEHTTPVAILLTHNHWDHIQGFPFFKPIYQADRDITIVVGDVEDEQTKNGYIAICLVNRLKKRKALNMIPMIMR
jgi:phosphoribosyl 1,2-cyclic phosphodiesterase